MKFLINYDNRVFRSKSNSESGEVDNQTVFHYNQEGHILKASYSGGQIQKGQMLGIVNSDGSLQFNYQHINTAGQLRSGTCTSTPQILEDGRILLHESWQWMDGNRGKGESLVEEEKE